MKSLGSPTFDEFVNIYKQTKHDSCKISYLETSLISKQRRVQAEKNLVVSKKTTLWEKTHTLVGGVCSDHSMSKIDRKCY